MIRCLEARARGYLLKDTSWAPLFAAIRPVARSEMLVWREAIERLLARDVALATNMANEPDHAASTGRFGALIPAAITLFERAWNPALAVPARPSAPGNDAPAPRGEGGTEG